MIPLHRVVHQPKPEPIAPAPERPRQRRKAPPAPQLPHVLPHPPRHVHRKPLLQHRPLPMPQPRRAPDGLAPRALPLPTPRPKLELALRHLDWASLPRRQPQQGKPQAVDPPAQRCVRHTDRRSWATTDENRRLHSRARVVRSGPSLSRVVRASTEGSQAPAPSWQRKRGSSAAEDRRRRRFSSSLPFRAHH